MQLDRGNLCNNCSEIFKDSTACKVSVFGVFLVCIFPHSARIESLRIQSEMRESKDQKNPEYGHFSRNVYYKHSVKLQFTSKKQF